MFSPLNDPQVEQWFQRLDATWSRMPVEDRIREREEIQQHLERLVSANIAEGQTMQDGWNAALHQFGNPTQIGRKMFQEWRQSRTGFRADMAAILFGFCWWAANYFLIQLLFSFPVITMFTGKTYPRWQDAISSGTVFGILAYGGAILPYILIGRKYPVQAIKAALYTYILSFLMSWIIIAPVYTANHSHYLVTAVRHSLSLMPTRLIGLVMLSYLVSVTKRGWYRPTWDDFKLTLPKRRRQVTH